MNEMQFGRRIRQILNQGTEVNPRVAERLRQAREAALARQRPEPAPAFAWADHALVRFGGWSGLALRVLLPLAMIVASGVAVYAWEQNRRAAELEEIDAQLLTDDLPIDAYLDRGFQNWLKQRAAEQ